MKNMTKKMKAINHHHRHHQEEAEEEGEKDLTEEVHLLVVDLEEVKEDEVGVVENKVVILKVVTKEEVKEADKVDLVDREVKEADKVDLEDKEVREADKVDLEDKEVKEADKVVDLENREVKEADKVVDLQDKEVKEGVARREDKVVREVVDKVDEMKRTLVWEISHYSPQRLMHFKPFN
ncbi:hypothetical protein JTE90_024949 [Oedothorax gibbosus]|uniref:Uncharacterized protein n=1 Tax=Oedothorax gibbosus TaxID=931172 RepID=A0AAV6VWL7_9ARAC|nr:hypothetical protein JTE90_024949 [Oedothorax gibbosus]